MLFSLLETFFTLNPCTCAKLYYEAGIDTLEKVVEWNPEDMKEMLNEFIEKNNFDGIATLPKEVVMIVTLARHLPKIVEH